VQQTNRKTERQTDILPQKSPRHSSAVMAQVFFRIAAIKKLKHKMCYTKIYSRGTSISDESC